MIINFNYKKMMWICYPLTTVVNPHIKNKAWEVIQIIYSSDEHGLSKFWFDDPPMRKVFVMSALDVQLRLWKEYKRNSVSETLLNRPENVPENQWGHFVHMRFTEKWKKMQERNIGSQKKNIMPHTIKTGKRPCRAEFFIDTRTKPNGSFVCEEAKTREEEFTTLLGQKSHVTNNAIASLDDEYAQVFGPERPGRVRCVGRGPTPSKLVNHSPVTRQEIENSEMVIDLKSQVKELSDQVKGMTTFIQQVIGTSTGEQVLLTYQTQLLPTYQFHQIQIRNGVMMLLETKTPTLEAMAVIFINISLIIFSATFNLFYFMNLHDGLVM
ncbi:hypothetical protein HID58_087037 [Brassica napus]|uniref:Uncharacterized protein n=1 Tax=Brassica napus TaxID=3708 RepID=A0ABQ7XUR1_BRANA|nr:hypothetical protein HID58_087037 [Brassica napus]